MHQDEMDREMRKLGLFSIGVCVVALVAGLLTEYGASLVV